MKRSDFFGNNSVVFARIREARDALNISQAQLAARMQTLGANLDQQAISLVEKNQRTVSDYELVCFSMALSVSLEWLLQDFDLLSKRKPIQ